MTYTHTTAIAFKSLIAERIGDVNKTFFTQNDIDLTYQEALLTFGATSLFFQDKVTFPAENQLRHYDISSKAKDKNGNLVLAKNLTYAFIIQLIQRDLLELSLSPTPIDTSAFITSQFSYASMINLIDVKINEYILKCGLNYSTITIPISANQDRIELPDYVIDIARIAFRDTTNNNIYYPLDKASWEDIQQFQFTSDYFNSIPHYFTIVKESNNVVFISPTAKVNGEIEIIYSSGIDLSSLSHSIPSTSSTIIPLPPNLIPYIRYGVLYEMLRIEGQGEDIARSQYCKKRWDEGVIVGINYSSVLNAYINDNYVEVGNVVDLDFYPNWQNVKCTSSIFPDILALTGFNLLSVNRYYDDSIADSLFSITLDVVINAPINDIYVQVREEYLDTLLSYCLHLLRFKEGFYEIRQTLNSIDALFQLSAIHNSRLNQYGRDIPFAFNKGKETNRRFDLELVEVGESGNDNKDNNNNS